MNFNNSLELTQSQKLIITMQLKQSLNILNMSKLELEEEIKREYEENPLLEVEKSGEVDWERYIKNIENSRPSYKNELYYNYDILESQENKIKKPRIFMKNSRLFPLLKEIRRSRPRPTSSARRRRRPV